jgi:hypothetical protein
VPTALTVITKDRETDWKFTGLVCFAYVAFLVWMHAHHEMWRDEVHPWSLARAAQGFGELVTGDRRYDGHPPLWHWYLHIWSWFVKEVWGLQAATIAAAAAAAMILLRFAPFPRYLKVLLLCTYYFGYEYAVVSRNYVLGWLLTFVFCAVYHPVRTRYLILALVLSLLGLTSVYGLAMGLCLLLFLVLDQVRVSASPSPPARITVALSPHLAAAVGVALAAFIFCAVIVEPVDPNPFSPAWSFNALNATALPDMLSRFVAGTLPLRRASLAYWGSPFAVWDSNPAWIPFIGAGVCLLALVALLPSWHLLVTYLAAFAIMEVIQQARYIGLPRHWGHYFMFLVAACWLLRSTFPRRRHLLSLLILLGMAGFQVQSFAVATVEDARSSFSGARETAAFIRGAGLQDLPFVAGRSDITLAVAVYLHRSFIAVETEEINETIVFHARRRRFSIKELIDRAVAVSRERQSSVLMVATQPAPLAPGATASLLFTSQPQTITGERFWVYRVTSL